MMKIYHKSIRLFGLLAMLFLVSCNDFLEEFSQDQIIPSSYEDLAAIMYSDAYPYSMAGDTYLNLLTDDYVCNGLGDETLIEKLKNGSAIFTYNSSMFDGTEAFPTDVNSWALYYEKIKGCNVIYDYLSEITATQKEINELKGQVLCLRGYYYMRLALIYCQIYNSPGVNPQNAMGLPLVLSMTVTDDFPERASLEDTYKQIESDLTEASLLLEENYTAESAFRVGYLTADALLTRMYLYKGRVEDLENVVKYANVVLNKKPILTNLYSFSSSFMSKGIYDQDVSTEALWVYGTASQHDDTYGPLYGNGVIPYSVSPLLISLYEPNDLRKDSYFNTGWNGFGSYYTKSAKKGLDSDIYGDRGIRIAEVYLNRAEAYCRLYRETNTDEYRQKALADLNTLRESRYAEGTYVPVELTTADELLTFCLEERRREMSLEEGLRWFDIKRLNLSVTHTYIDANGISSEHVLNAGDPLYALPIPYDAIERNYKLGQNPR